MTLTPLSHRPSRRLLSAVLLASFAFAAEARAELAKPEPAAEADKKAPEPRTQAVAPAAEPSAPKVTMATKSPTAHTAKAKASRQASTSLKTPALEAVPKAIPKTSTQAAASTTAAALEPSPKVKAKPSSTATGAAASALEPMLSPPAPEKMTEAGFIRRKAMIALNTGHYEEAIKAFEEAYALEQDPVLLFRLAQAYRLSGQPTKALDACEAALRSMDKNVSERSLVEQFVVEMEMIAYQIRLQREYGVLPRSGPVPQSPPAQTSSPLVSGPNSQPAPKLEPSRAAELTQVPITASVESTPFYRRTYFWVAVGGVVAAGATAAIWYAASSHGSRAPQTALGYQGAYQ